MGFFELVILETLLFFSIGLLFIIAGFLSSENLILIIVCIILGVLLFIFSKIPSSWWTYLRLKEREKVHEKYGLEESLLKMIFYDFGKYSNIAFKIFAFIIISLSIYHLITYFNA
jgi:hypothetical protein